MNRELPWLVEYGNILTLNTTWRFFSPNPLIRTVEYKTYEYENDIPTEQEFLFPEPPKGLLQSLFNREKYNRTLNYSMLITSREEWAQAYLSKLLCRMHPKADEIAVFQVHREFMPIEKARFMQDYRSLMKTKRRRVADFQCQPEVTDEVTYEVSDEI